MATVTGARGTNSVLAAQRKIDMSEKVLDLDANATPLTVLARRLSKKRTINPEFKHLEGDRENRWDAVNNGAGYADNATAIVVDTGARFAQHYLTKVTRTGEVMRVTAVATNTLTVVRAVGSTAAAIVDNDELLVIGVAQPEGDTSRPARSNNPTAVLNYTQIFRTPVEATETWRHSEGTTTPNDWQRQRNMAGLEHNLDIEFALWHGTPSEDLTGSQPRRTTGGVFHFATQNQTDAGGAFTEAEWFAALRPGFRYGPTRKTAFGSPLALDVLNGFARGKLEVQQGEQTYGLRVTTYISPHGEIRFVSNPLFEGSKYAGYIAILDMEKVQWRFLANEEGSRDTHVLTKIQAPDADTRKDEYLTEGGLSFGNPKHHAIVTGITG